MIRRFRQVNDNLFRGSGPSIEDVIFLNKKVGINKIVSLDEAAGQHIDRATKLLGMKHIMSPIDINRRHSLIEFLKRDLYKLLMDDGPVYVHCQEGKDRTGLAIAMFRCLYDEWTCDEALKEAVKLGFGVGVNKKVVHLYKDIIQSACETSDKKHKHIDHNTADDIGYADIATNQRDELMGGAYTLDSFEQQSWSPWEDYTVREFPFASAYPVYFPEQYESRVSEVDDEDTIPYNGPAIPQSGTWDTSTDGIMGAGPSLIGSGFI